MNSTKPKYWIVKNDGSQLFKDTVIKKLNEICKSVATPWAGSSKGYYGYDGGEACRGTNASKKTEDFANNPTLLTLREFCSFFTETTIIDVRLRECERIKNLYFDKIEFLTKKNNSLTVNSSKLKNYEYMESLVNDYRIEISDLKDENDRLLDKLRKIRQNNL